MGVQRLEERAARQEGRTASDGRGPAWRQARGRPDRAARPCSDASPRLAEQRNQGVGRSEEHTSELQSLIRISYAVFCLKKKTVNTTHNYYRETTTIYI